MLLARILWQSQSSVAMSADDQLDLTVPVSRGWTHPWMQTHTVQYQCYRPGGQVLLALTSKQPYCHL